MNNKLSNEIIMDLVKNNTNLFEGNESLSIKEVGDGNVNYIYLVTGNNNSVIVKFADSYIRNSDTRQLSTKRNEIEYDILKKQFELSGGKTPEVYYYSSEYNCILMENLSEYDVLREGMLSKKIYPHLGKQIGEFLYNTLFKTTDLVLSPEEKKDIQSKLVNKDMCEISERLVFTEPYLNTQKLNKVNDKNEDFIIKELYEDSILQLEVAKLKNKYMNKSESMIHGDLHGGSIFINKADVKVFDPEFAFYGPMGYDIGNVIGNLIISYVTEIFINGDENYTDWIKDSIKDTIDSFIDIYNENYIKDVNTKMFKTNEFKDFYLKEIVSDTLGYAGTEMIRRTVGVAKVWDLDKNQEHDAMPKIERTIIKIGKKFILNRDEIAKSVSLISIIDEIISKDK